MAKTPYYTKAESDAKNQQVFREVKETTQAISAGEGGKLYSALAVAQAVTPKPVNGTIFTVSEITDGANAGYHVFDSTKTGGTRFERAFGVNESDIGYGFPLNNIIEQNNYVTGYMVTTSGGEVYVQEGYKSTGFVDVSFLDVNKIVTIVNLAHGYGRAVHYYDENQVNIDFGTPPFLSVTNGKAVIDARPTEQVHYMRFTVKTTRSTDTTDVLTVMVLQNDTGSTTYIPYERNIISLQSKNFEVIKVPTEPENDFSPTSKSYVDKKAEEVRVKDLDVYEDAEELKNHTTVYGGIGSAHPGWIRPGSGLINRVVLKIAAGAANPTITFRIGYQSSLGVVFDQASSFTELTTKQVLKSELPIGVDYFNLDFNEIIIPEGKYVVILSNSPLETAVFNDPVPGVTNYSLLYKDVAGGATAYNYGFKYSAFVSIQYINREVLKIVENRLSTFKSPNSDLFSLSGKKMAVLGDSITAPIDSWVSHTANLLGLNYVNFAVSGAHFNDYYNGANNITEINLSGVSNISGDYSTNTISNQVRRLIQYVTAQGQQMTWTHPITGEIFSIPVEYGVGLGNSEFVPNVIVIAASTNDTATIEAGEEWSIVRDQTLSNLTRKNLYSSIRWAVETLMIVFPKSQIFLATPIQGFNRLYYSGGSDRRERILTVGNYFNCQIIDALNESGISEKFERANADGEGRYLHDGLHPSINGSQLIGNYFSLQIKNKYFPKV